MPGRARPPVRDSLAKARRRATQSAFPEWPSIAADPRLGLFAREWVLRAVAGRIIVRLLLGSLQGSRQRDQRDRRLLAPRRSQSHTATATRPPARDLARARPTFRRSGGRGLCGRES